MGREPRIEVELVEDDPGAHRHGTRPRPSPRSDAPSPHAGAGVGSVPGPGPRGSVPGARPRESVPGADGPGGSAGGSADDAQAPQPRRLRPRTVVAAGVALAAGLVGTQAVLDARERAAYARYADVPGVVAPLSPDLEVLWRAGAEHVGVLWAGLEVEGLRLGAWFDEAGTPTAGAIDPATGELGWSVPLGERETLLEGHVDRRAWVPCDTVTGGSPLLVCLVPSEHTRVPPGQVPAELLEGLAPEDHPLVAGSAELVVLDAATGDVVRRAPEEVGTGMAVLGDLVVTARVREDDAVVVTGTGARTGEVVWESTTQPGTATGGPPPAVAGPGPRVPGIARVGDGLLVQAGSGGLRVGADGTVEAMYVPTSDDTGSDQGTAAGSDLREGEGVGGTSVTSARGHVLRHGMRGGMTYLLRDDGTRTAVPGGFPVPLSVDDGSEPDLLLVPDGNNGVAAWDTRTGSTRWSRPDVMVGDAVVVLGGTLHVATIGGVVVALDLTDGTTLWTSAGTPGAPGIAAVPGAGLLTDGRVLAVVGQRLSEASTVRAYALGDGRPLWTAELPPGVGGARAMAGQVVGWNESGDEWSVLG